MSSCRGTPFDIHIQQDVPEILAVLIDELRGTSQAADDILSSSLINITTCEQCHSFSQVETKEDIIQLPLTNSMSSSLNSFFAPDNLRGSDRWFCTLCDSLQDSVRETRFVNCGNVLILQLLRYANFNGKTFKDNRKFTLFTDTITIPVVVDDIVTMRKTFKLKATINHSGTKDAGHYWSFIKEEKSNAWLKCNDTSVIPVNFTDLSNGSSYVLIYSCF